METLVKGAYVKTKTVTHDNGESLTWEFNRLVASGSNIPQEVTITNPDKGITKYQFAGVASTIKPSKIEEFAADGTTKIHEQRRFWANSSWLSKEIVSVFGNSGNKSAITTYNRDDNGNLLEKTEYDWVSYGTVNGSTIRRRTTYNYYIPSGTKYSDPFSTSSIWVANGPRRVNAVQRITVYEGSTAKAATEYVYDYAYTKGNVLYERRWDTVKTNNNVPPPLGNLNSSNSQEFHYSYDQYGNVIKIIEPLS